MSHFAFVKESGGVASTQQVARYLGVPSSVVRDWAADNDVRRIGAAYVFDVSAVTRLAEALDEDEADDIVDDDEDTEDEDTEDEDELPDDEEDFEDEEE